MRGLLLIFEVVDILIRSDVEGGGDECDYGCGWGVDKVRSPHSYWQFCFSCLFCACRSVGGLGFWAHFEIKMCALCRFFNRPKRPAIHHVEINHYGTWTYYPLWQSLDAQESTELVSNQLL